MTPELIALVMGGLLLLGLFMGHPLAFVLGSTAVIGALVAGKPMVQQHQLVYAPLQQWLKSGELHALALKTYSPEQWKKLGAR